jgi:hypothetical protein
MQLIPRCTTHRVDYEQRWNALHLRAQGIEIARALGVLSTATNAIVAGA